MFVCFPLPLIYINPTVQLITYLVFFFPPELAAPVTELASIDGCPLFNSCSAPCLVQAKLQSHACADALEVNGTTPEPDKDPSRQSSLCKECIARSANGSL